MPKTIPIRIRVDAARKRGAEKILRRMGLTTGQVVNLTLAQIELRKGLPFAVTASDDGYPAHVPNAETLASLHDTAEGESRSVRGFQRAMRRP